MHIPHIEKIYQVNENFKILHLKKGEMKSLGNFTNKHELIIKLSTRFDPLSAIKPHFKSLEISLLHKDTVLSKLNLLVIVIKKCMWNCVN